mmetsp:Transcript_7181/g.13502  ORF Transcript_7181/g.13502 Transcript_7181/m.13502 type:complete len:122 (-) Transcript_7181:5-370(-)
MMWIVVPERWAETPPGKAWTVLPLFFGGQQAWTTRRRSPRLERHAPAAKAATSPNTRLRYDRMPKGSIGSAPGRLRLQPPGPGPSATESASSPHVKGMMISVLCDFDPFDALGLSSHSQSK